MAHEGMVHALEEIHRLLKPDGILIDIHPVPEGYFIKVHLHDSIVFSERMREACSDDVLQAERTLEKIIGRNLFTVEQRDEFDFLTYASSTQELRNYWEDLNEFEDDPKNEVILAREEYLYAKANAVMRKTGAGSEVAFHERARITRLKPVK